MRLFLLLLFLAFPAGAAPPLKVVASFSILADLAAKTGGGLVSATALVGPGADLHQFQPRPENAKQLAGADLVLINGLGVEGWIGQLVAASGFKGPVVVLADRAPIRRIEGDPHVWQDAGNARLYAAAIAEAYAALRPDQAEAFRANAARYEAELAALQDWIKQTLPSGAKMMVVPHDGFAYFAAAYGVQVEALQPNSEAEPSPRRYAALTKLIQTDHILAVFGEAFEDDRIMRQLAKDGGGKLAGKLYADTLSPPDGPAADYIALMRYNVSLIAAKVSEADNR
jgi:zinc/manganese transport system substrate-binding protein